MKHGPLTPEVRVRLLEASDEPLYEQLYGDEATMRHVGPALEQAQARRSFAAACRANQSTPPTARFWVIEQTLENTPIGLIGLHWDGPASAELGVVLPPCQQGKGIATAATRLLLEHAFGSLQLDRLHTWHALGHEPAAGLMASLGFAPSPDRTGREGQCWELTASQWRTTFRYP